MSLHRDIRLTICIRMKATMWADLANELGVPWRSAEAMHWRLGAEDMARRANAVPFAITPTSYSNQPAIPSPSYTSAFEPVFGAPDPVERHNSAIITDARQSYDPGSETGMGTANQEAEAGERRRRRRPIPATLAMQGQQLAPVGLRMNQGGTVVLPSLAEVESGITAQSEALAEQQQLWERESDSRTEIQRRHPSRGVAQPPRGTARPQGVEKQGQDVMVKGESQESDDDE